MTTTMDNTQFICFCIFLWFICTVLLHFIFKKPSKPPASFCLPPSPPALPIIGHIHYLSPMLHRCFHNLSSKYGPLLHLRLASYPVVLVSSAPMAAEIFRTHDVKFASRPPHPLKDILLFGNSGFTTSPYGDYWRFMKKLCISELLGPRQLERSRNVRREELMHFLHKLMEKGQENEVVDIGGELMKLTNNTICRMSMSTRCSAEDNVAERVRELVKDSMELIGKLILAHLLGPLQKLWVWAFYLQSFDVPRKLDELLENLLKEHEERAKRDGGKREDNDLMDILLQVHKDEDAEFKISRTHIKAFLVDLFVAGTNSSSDTLQWLMAEIINHPNTFRKLRNEIESVVGRNRLVEETDIPNLQYLQAVVKETLRLYGAPTTIRVCRETCKVGEYDIPEGTLTAINLYSIMRDPKIWENPNEFHPERFLVKENQKESMAQNFGYVPFGGGRRMCPGMNLAYSLIYTTTAAVVQCFDLEVCGGVEDHGTRRVNMEAKGRINIAMAHPLLCLPTVHFNPFRT